jgi:hypothetical protein
MIVDFRDQKVFYISFSDDEKELKEQSTLKAKTVRVKCPVCGTEDEVGMSGKTTREYRCRCKRAKCVIDASERRATWTLQARPD